MANNKEPTEIFSNSDYDSDAELITRSGSVNPDVTDNQTKTSFKTNSLCPCLKTRRYTLHRPQPDKPPFAPHDRLNLVYLCFFLAGAGFLFPFNSYVSAIDYFYCLYKVQFSAVSEILPMVYLVITSFSSTLNLLLVERLPISLRITFGYVMFSIALFFVPMLDIGINNHTVSTGVSFYLTLITVLIVGFGSGFQQSSYYGLSSMLPPRYSQALLAGESVAGFIVAINRIFTKLFFSERVGAIVFFAVSLLFVWLCVVCYVYIMRSPFVKYHMSKCKDTGGSEDQEMKEMTLSDGNQQEEQDGGEAIEDNGDLLIPSEGQHTTLMNKICGAARTRLVVLSQIWRLMVTIFTAYFVTLLIFPGLVSEIQYDVIGDWTPVVLILLFNFSDFVAKWLALIKIRWSSTALMLVGFLRLILIPVAIMCVSPSPCDPVLATGIMGWAVVLVITLGLSNGYFGSLPMINVSMEVKKQKDREVAGSIMIWAVLLGLTAGSVLAYALSPLTRLDNTCTQNSTCSLEIGYNSSLR